LKKQKFKPQPKPRRKFVQARGDVRRKLLLETALKLLRKHYLDDITFQGIAREAGVPLASCYHFFPGKMQLFADLIDYAGPWHKFVTVSALVRRADNWMDIFRHLSDALIKAYESNRAFVQLFTTWKIPGSGYPGREQGLTEAAERIRQGIDRQFVRPQFSEEVEVFACVVRFTESIWRASMDNAGRVSEFARREAHRAAVSYLCNYLPPILERRPHPLDMPALQLPDSMPAMISEWIDYWPRKAL